MKVINGVSGAPAPVGAYSQAVRHGNTLYISGQIGLDPESGAMVTGDVRAQVRQVLANLGAILGAVGSDWNKVLMTTIFLSDITCAKIVNEEYSTVVSQAAPPARQTVAVKDLPLDALVEVSLIAAIP